MSLWQDGSTGPCSVPMGKTRQEKRKKGGQHGTEKKKERGKEGKRRKEMEKEFMQERGRGVESRAALSCGVSNAS